MEQRELNQKQIAKLTPLGFAHWATGGRTTIPPHLALLNRYLVEVAARRITRLMVFMPPRHGKSTTISQWFPAWYLGNFPDNRIILTSYEANFARSWGRKARNILQEHGPEIFDVAIDDDSAAADEWNIKGHEGGMKTAGVGGPITGRGADVLVIDDPVKNADDAESPTLQERNKDWFDSTALTRLEPNGCIVVLMTRWSRGDLAGRLLADNPGEWNVIELPALARENDILGRGIGDALWPERYDEEALRMRREAMTAFWWHSLYQQDPLAARGSGSKFRRDWFEIVPCVPMGGRAVRYWDLAATEPKRGQDPDWTAGAWMTEYNGDYYLKVDRIRAAPSTNLMRP